MADSARKISLAALAGIIVVYLVIVQGVGVVSTIGLDGGYGEFPDVETLVRGLIVPVGLSAVFAAVVISVLGWWRPVLHEPRPVARWVWFVPVLMLVTILAVTDYGNLADQGGGFVATMLVASLMVGVGEELMFRGIAITAFRVNDFTERRVALWSSIVFGGAHITNIISEGPSSILQVIVVSFSGFFFYLIRRVSGGIVLPIVMHGLWDFSQFSGSAGPEPDVYPLQGLAMLCNVVLAVTLWIRRDEIGLDAEPGRSVTPAR